MFFFLDLKQTRPSDPISFIGSYFQPICPSSDGLDLLLSAE
jgi:hypothetical protein